MVMAVKMGLEAVALYKSPRAEVTLSNGKLVTMRAGMQTVLHRVDLTKRYPLLTYIQGLLHLNATAAYQETWISLVSRI